MTRREAFIKAGLELMGMAYLWDGKGFAGEPYHGRDCSGFVTERLFSVGGPDLRDTWNTAALWSNLPGPGGPILPGDLVLYGDENEAPHHVMVVLGVGDLVYGSAGGDHTTITLQAALLKGAKVQIWPSKDWMSGFLGYRRFPWLDAAGGQL